MATDKERLEIIDSLNDAYINQGVKQRAPVYEAAFERIIAESLESAENGNVSQRQIRSIVRAIPISPQAIITQTYQMALLSGITNVIENQRLAVDERLIFEPINRILRIYTPRNPERLARKTNALIKAYLRNETLRGRDAEALTHAARYFNRNRKFIREQVKRNFKRFNEVNNLVKDSLGKTIRKTLQREINTRIEITVNGETVTRPKTFQEIRKSVKEKFGKQIQFRVERILDTELHSMAETVKIDQHADLGYTHKRWNTQRDNKVRDEKDANHRAMHGVTIPINEKFKVKGGGRGMYAGDPNLPPRQYINCRCFITYQKRI